MPVSFSEFKKPSLSDWKDKANADLKGKMIADDMVYKVEPGLQIPVFLNQENTKSNPSMALSVSKAGAVISDISNDKVLNALEQGAQALLIKWCDDTPIAPFFDQVIIDIIYLTIDDRYCNNETISALKHFMASNGHENVVFLSDGVNILLADDTITKRIQFVKSNPQKTVLLELKADFLAQIAELRAIRALTHANPIKILATLDSILSSSADRQSLIAINYAMMSAYLGGADAVFGCPYGGDDSMARLTLNIQHILQLESAISDVIDPLAGAYLVEKLTDEMIGLH